MVESSETRTWREKSDLIIDSGARVHCCYDIGRLMNYKPLCMPKSFGGVGGHRVKAYGTGDLLIKTTSHGDLLIKHVYWIPKACVNLLSTETLRTQCKIFYTNEGHCLYKRDAETATPEVVAYIDEISGTPVLRGEAQKAVPTESRTKRCKLWWRRFLRKTFCARARVAEDEKNEKHTGCESCLTKKSDEGSASREV